MAKEKPLFFIDPERAPSFSQMEGLETTVLTGLRRERMMMVLNATLPGHTVPLHSHPTSRSASSSGGRPSSGSGARSAA